MAHTSFNKILLAILLFGSATTMVAQEAQETQEPATPPSGDGSGGSNSTGQQNRKNIFNPDQFREMMTQRLKTELKVSDEEWTILQPLVENVMTKQRETGAIRMEGLTGRSRRGGRGPTAGGSEQAAQNISTRSTATTGGDQSGSKSSKPEIDALKKALEATDSSNEDLTAKLTAVRENREKHTEELKKAREDLRKVLTLRQEAALVLMGILD